MAIQLRTVGRSPRLMRERKKHAKRHPLKDLPNFCCSTGECRSVEYWSVDYEQEGLLKIGDDIEPTPVQLFTFSSHGLGVVAHADFPIQEGSEALLITQAHGAGCSYRRVRCCWHHPHPHDAELQCIGLRFHVDTGPELPQEPSGSS